MRSRIRFFVLLAVLFAVPGARAAAASSLEQWDLRSAYMTPKQARVSLSPREAALTGPTGQRTFVRLPDGYDPARCYPVLYLLHGTASTGSQWFAGLDRLDGVPAIVVMAGGVTAGTRTGTAARAVPGSRASSSGSSCRRSSSG